MRFHPRAQLALCIFFLFALPAAGADDVISVGAATYVKPGQTAEVPVYVRDLTGSPVGKDIEKPIRYLQFTVAFSHPELIEGCTNQTFPACEVAFRTAGVLERKPLAGTPVTFVGGTSIFVRRIVNGTIDWNLDARS
jgi:hypothetical protein